MSGGQWQKKQHLQSARDVISLNASKCLVVHLDLIMGTKKYNFSRPHFVLLYPMTFGTCGLECCNRKRSLRISTLMTCFDQSIQNDMLEIIKDSFDE